MWSSAVGTQTNANAELIFNKRKGGGGGGERDGGGGGGGGGGGQTGAVSD